MRIAIIIAVVAGLFYMATESKKASEATIQACIKAGGEFYVKWNGAHICTNPPPKKLPWE